MGGDYYDRDVVSTTSSTGYSAAASQAVGKTTSLHFSLDPKKYKDKNLISEHKNPIIFAIDGTGSMRDWSKLYKYFI